MYGGNATSVFNDIRSLDPYTMEWSVIQKEGNKDLQGRFGYCLGTFNKYIIAFGGFGQIINKRGNQRAIYSDLLVYDTEQNTFLTFGSHVSAFKSQVWDKKKQRDLYDASRISEAKAN